MLLYVHRDHKDYYCFFLLVFNEAQCCFTSTKTIRTMYFVFKLSVALRPQRPQGLLVFYVQAKFCFMSTETIRTVGVLCSS